MNKHAAYMNLQVMKEGYDVDPVFAGDSNTLLGYDVMKNGQLFMHIPTGTSLSEHQIQSLIFSKLTGKPSGVVLQSSLLKRVWARMNKKASCRACKASISHGTICDLCYGGVNAKGH